MNTSFDAATAVAWISRAAELVRADEARLTALDAAIGDGDHGANLNRGLTAAVAAVDEAAPGDPGKVLVTAGRGVVAKTGGASGPLYGTAFRRAGKEIDGATDPATLARGLEAMVQGVVELGGAAPGDKTMVDALGPAATAFRDAITRGDGLHDAAVAAAEAGEGGLAATVPLQARKGRASYLGARSVGHEDPGAASSVLILRALADVTA